MTILKKISNAAEQIRLLYRKKTPTQHQHTHNDAQRLSMPTLEFLPDDELERLNNLLPWAAYIVDGKGREFGRAYSKSKRSLPQEIPDRRIVELDKRFRLKNKNILEVGCFEGIHTVALANHGANVTAVDGRIENVLKTLVRCHFLNVTAKIHWWDLEKEKPTNINSKCDILHHVGVLYHLADPIGHLDHLLDDVNEAIMLDTHIATNLCESTSATHGDFSYKYTSFNESGRDAPFAGLTPTARWVASDDLLTFIRKKGFLHAEVSELRNERNGPRVLIFAHR